MALDPERVHVCPDPSLPLLSPGVRLIPVALPSLAGDLLVLRLLLTVAVTKPFIFPKVLPRQVPRLRHLPRVPLKFERAAGLLDLLATVRPCSRGRLVSTVRLRAPRCCHTATGCSISRYHIFNSWNHLLMSRQAHRRTCRILSMLSSMSVVPNFYSVQRIYDSR